MVFSSLTFLLLFLPITLGLYFVKKSIRWRNGVLLIVSLLFYAWGEPLWIFAMVASALVNWLCAAVIGASRFKKVRKTFLIIGAVFAGAMLFACKYSTFFANSFLSVIGSETRLKGFALPIGISFYTFQIISYTVDVYRGDVKPQKSFARLLLYVSCFPQLIAGPIVRYTDVAQQIGKRATTPEGFSSGMQRFILGLGKKVIFANILGLIMNELPVAGGEAALSVVGSWYAAFIYMLQIYFDFSGYSDMAIGIGRILGFDYKENFDYPYASLSVREFWRRWHISLGAFFRDYVYIPLGGNRKGAARTILNTLIVWGLTGMWHGAAWNFILWGLYYGIILVLDLTFFKPIIKKLPKAVNWVITFLLVLIGWVIFYYTDVSAVGVHLGAMFGLGGGFTDAASLTVIKTYSVFPLIALIASMPVVPRVKKWMQKTFTAKVNETVRIVSYSAILVFSVLFLVGQSVNPFIYFQF